MESPARMTRQPAPHLGRFVGGIVVENGVDEFAGRGFGLQGVEEANELLMAIALHVLAEHRSFEHVERGKQRCRSMALVVVGHGRRAALLHRQARLGPVERLDLALLVDAEHHGMRRRADMESDDGAELLGEGGIVGQFEGTKAMRRGTVRNLVREAG